MRQLAAFESADQARTLAAYLVTQRISAHAEADGGSHSVWVRDENQLPSAREALAHFLANPRDPRYANAETVAGDVRRQQEAEQAARQKNVVEMRGRWKSGPGIKRKAPLTIGLIVVSVLAAIGTDFGKFDQNGPTGLLNKLTIVDANSLAASYLAGQPDYFASVRGGQFWRLITPILIHFSMMHLIFNMWWMFVLGGQVEDRLGSRRFGLLVIVLAVASVAASAIVHQWQKELALAGGMSGVGYGMFGYLWMKVKFAPGDAYQLDRLTVGIGMTWLILCILRDFPPFDQLLSGLIPGRVDNVGHVVGLVVGMVAGYFPILFKRR